MQKTLYARIDAKSHRLLCAYAAEWDLTLQMIVERSVEMILYQVSDEFRAPEWLREAIASGSLKLRRCGEPVEDEDADADADADATGVFQCSA